MSPLSLYKFSSHPDAWYNQSNMQNLFFFFNFRLARTHNLSLNRIEPSSCILKEGVVSISRFAQIFYSTRSYNCATLILLIKVGCILRFAKIASKSCFRTSISILLISFIINCCDVISITRFPCFFLLSAFSMIFAFLEW